MNPRLLTYYEAIERASEDMVVAARTGNWDEVVKLEGACVLLISQLRMAADGSSKTGPDDDAGREAARTRSRIMQRILLNDAEIRQLAEPWLADLDSAIQGRARTLH